MEKIFTPADGEQIKPTKSSKYVKNNGDISRSIDMCRITVRSFTDRCLLVWGKILQIKLIKSIFSETKFKFQFLLFPQKANTDAWEILIKSRNIAECKLF